MHHATDSDMKRIFVMAEKPETKFIRKLKTAVLKDYPTAYWKKHSHQFSHGLPDLEIILPHSPIALDCWFEVKWIPKISQKRKIQYRPLQKEDLEQRAKLGVPCGLIVGCPKGIAWYHGSHLPTHAVIQDFWINTPFQIDMFLQAHYGLMTINKISRGSL